MNSVLKILGNVIRKKREDFGLSQEELADMSEIHRTYISQIERGLKGVTIKVLFSIAASLKTTPSEILKEVEEQYEKESE
ncbi:helix-turn-helix domain-containing protein [Brevibacillus borstelensis]